MEVYYKPKDIVWVKLGPFWWPGEVVEKSSVPEDLIELLKKEPIAIVKFFDDDGFYEFVKTSETIFPYNCDRKFDFIKKGMDAYRANNPKLASFPKDVSAAEVKTGGNANILSDPFFTKERKRNYAAEIFGSPAAKKPRESIKSRTTQSEPLITHRRFLGYDDYEARVLIPSAEDTIQDDETPAIAPRTEIFNKFTCPSCHFSSDRLGILMKHTSCHIKEISFQSRNPIKKIQKKKRKRALSDNDVSSDGKKTKAKRKSTKKKVEAEDASSESSEDFAISLLSVSSTPSVRKDTKPTVEQKKDICDDIIADWDDESNHEDSLVDDTTLVSTLSEIQPSEIIVNTSLLDSSTFQPLSEDLQSTKIDEDTSEKKNKPSEESITDKLLIAEKNPNKSCFDFDEDEEETRIPDATSGRKIPRVIPISERRKTYELEDEIIDDEEEKKKKEILQESEALSKLTESSKDADKESENLEKTYQSLMESTENLEIPDVPNILKNEQNFHSAKTVKYPDKDVVESSDLIEPEVIEDKTSASEKTEVAKETQSAECSSTKVNEQKSTEESVQLLDERIDSKFEIKESDLDALMAKHEMEPENLEKELDIESGVSPNVSFSVNDVVVTDDIPHNERQLQEDIKSAENENKNFNKEKETVNEIPLSKQENQIEEIVISQEVEMGETISIEESSSLTISEQIVLQSEKSSETKVDDIKLTSSDNKEDQKLEPESKRRKTDENKSRFAKTKENSSRKNRRGRSGDAEKAKLTEDDNLSLLEKDEKELKKPASSRSTRQVKDAIKVDDKTLPSLTLPIQGIPKEENKVNIETRELNQNSEIDNEKKLSESVEADITEKVKPLSNEEKEVSVPTSQIDDATTSNEKLQTAPERKEKADETEDKSNKLKHNEKSYRSRRSPVKEKRLSDSDKTHKKESESKDDSPHRSSKRRRTSSRHEKRKLDSLEGEKVNLHDDLQTKHFKESETPKKANNSKDGPSDREIRRSSDRERNPRRSSRNDSKRVDEHPQKSKKSPVKELVEDQKARNSSSRDSKRQSRSSKSSRDSFSSLDGKKLKSPDSKEPKTLTSGESKTSVGREAKTPPTKESKSPVGKEPKMQISKEPKTPTSKEPKTPINKERKTSSNKESPKTPTSKQPKASISKETKTPSKESEALTTKEQKTPTKESKTRDEQKTPTKYKESISPYEKTKDTISPTKKEPVELESRLRKSGKSLGKDEIDPIRELFAPSVHVSKTKEQKREELKNIFSFDYDEKDLKKRKTYSHRRKSKPISPEKSESEGSQATVVTLPSNEETPEVQKEVLLKSEEMSIPIEEAKPEETKENVEQILEEISPENEVIIDVGTEETVFVSKQEENACTSEAQLDEIIDKQSTESDSKIEITPASEIASNKVTDSVENKIDEEGIQNKQIETTDQKQPVNHNVLKENEVVVSKDLAEKKEEISKVAKPRKPRKPSRWDQVEKTTVCSAQETIKSHNDEEITKEESKAEIANVEIPKDTSIIATTAQVSLDVDESSQTEIAEILSKKRPFNLEDKNADQIELIFGSSPLPGSSENNIFGRETEKLAEIDQSHALGVTKDEKAKEEFSHDGNSSKDLSFDLVSDMDSLESQVARITHYEEPAIEQKNEVELVAKDKVESISNNPEKSDSPVLESMPEKVDTLVESLPEQSSLKAEETVPLEAESTITVVSKTEETHLSPEKTEENEKPADLPCDAAAAPKPSDKPNEVATKLTNPKKRFVKCFEASELDKRQREKSLEAEQAASTAKETKPQTSSITGKPPIAFKLKKQFLSKVSSIFDEDDDKKETKALPKLKPLKKDHSFLCKKKESVSIAKNENLPTQSCEITDKIEKKTENTKKIDVVEKICTGVEELSKEPLNMPIVKNLLSGLTPVSDEKKEVLCQKEVVDVTPIKNLGSENSSSLVLFSSESNSIDFCIDSTKSMLANIEEFKELQPTLNEQVHNIVAGPLDKPDDQIDISKTEIITKNFPIDENKKEETEYVSIDGNLTVVSEKELAEGQVEITANMSSKKPMTLSSFSMDFSDDSNDAISESIRNKKIQDIADSLVAKVVEEEKEETIITRTDFEQKPAVDVKDNSEVTKDEEEKHDEKLIEDNKEHVEICTIENPINNIEIESISFEEKQPTIDVVQKEQILVDETTSQIASNVTEQVLVDVTTQIAPNVTTQVLVDETTSQIASNVIEQVLVDVATQIAPIVTKPVLVDESTSQIASNVIEQVQVDVATQIAPIVTKPVLVDELTSQIASNITEQVLVDVTTPIVSNVTKEVLVDETAFQISSNVTKPVELVDSQSSAEKNQTEAIAVELAVKKTDKSKAISLSKNDSKVKETDSQPLSIVNEIETLPKTAKQSEIKSLTQPAESVPTRSRVKESAKSNEMNVVNEPLVIYNTAKSSTVTDMCDLEDHIPSQIVCTKINEEVMKVAGINNDLSKEKPVKEPEMPKLLIREGSDKKEDTISKIRASESEAKTRELEKISIKSELNSPKNLPKPIIKSKTVNPVANPAVKSSNKAIILSEKIIRPAREVAVPAQKRSYEDIEDIEQYVIAKTPKLEPITQQKISATPKNSKQFVINTNRQVPGLKKTTGKAKILNQTIIRPASDAVQINKIQVGEDNIEFDINSMPIVLSDELLTPESLESMPIVLGEQAQKSNPTKEGPKILIEKKAQSANKSLTKPISLPTQATNPPTVRMPLKKTTPKILQTTRPPQKIMRQVTPVSSKASKFVVVPEHPNRQQQMVKKQQPNLLRKALTPTCAASTTQSTSSETTGHKIMIFTNQQGKQQRLLLTPAQQKLIGMQLPGKTVVKTSAVTQKSQLVKVQTGTQASTSKLPGQAPQTPKFKMNVGTPQLSSPQLKIVPPRKSQKVPGVTPGKSQQKTILISNQHGQMVKKIQGTNEALLDKQVAEQLEAIKNSSLKAHQKQQEATAKAPIPKSHTVTSRKPSIKRSEPKQPMAAQTKPALASTPTRISEPKIPPLTPLQHESQSEELQKQSQSKPVQKNPDRPLHQLVIQDNMGNQTTITEGQILALPSETVDGQPQSYMLVTLDETGNLTPLNNEALMSLDPSLAGLAGGDLSNMVLQMDAGTSKDNVSHTAKLHAAPPSAIIQEKPRQEVQQMMPSKTTPAVESAQVQVTCNINGEQGQQIILTGDPVATQKFLDSLTDGSTDLSNILAGAEGNSILIQADGQQILINTESTDTAGMLEHNTPTVDPHDQGNPMFSTHPGKNQDILAAALADTDVFQSEQVTSQGKITHSQLSPGQSLFPMNVGNVVETCLTLNSPIMTPLEVPSTNSKRIPDEEADILTTHVPKNVDLPITITDPNISQTVSHQQVLMASDLQSNLELTLPISETSMSVSVGMHSPSFVYSLPSLDVSEHTEISQKTFSGSMPLLTEDIEIKSSTVIACKENSIVRGHMRKIGSGGTFMEEGLCNLGAEMCSSLSEPPPEMFDIPIENDYLNNKSLNTTQEKSNVPSVESGLLTDDNSLEISVQSQIVSDFKDSSQSSDSSSSVSQDKKL